MPDSTSSHRPVVRKITPEQKNFITNFDHSSSSLRSSSPKYGGSKSTSSSSPSTSSLSERSGYLRKTSLNRDSYMEEKVLRWIALILEEKPTKNFDKLIQDGSVLSKVMTSIVFNSVPLEDIDISWGTNPAHDRVKKLISEMSKYGVKDIFDPEDLLELRNVPKVTKCLYELSKLATSDKHNLLNSQRT
ncbi:uncharacterized protein [Lepeophtheirus salmonis]|uniref:uncharacterized protein n=1 Tax=Lepeophtheirus salmonis TaxID=72036 RepID=UPI001AE74203|nr:uncharacterized protein LOC121113508 [Lepeophtheirus salmonis]